MNKKVVLLLFFMTFSLLFAKERQEKTQSKFIVVTPPKCGTHMLIKALKLVAHKRSVHSKDYHLDNYDSFIKTLDLCEKQNKFIQTHIPPDPELIAELKRRQYKVITIVRDPRDQLISSIHWIIDGKDAQHLFDVPVHLFSLLTFEEQIDELITGEIFGFRVFDELYRRHYGWLDLDPGMILTTRFEDLVGSKGGGDNFEQEKTIIELAKYIGINLSDDRVKRITKNLFGGSYSFRKGLIGQWKTEFTNAQKQTYTDLYEDDLLYLGYEL